jgi:hypothetical protein
VIRSCVAHGGMWFALYAFNDTGRSLKEFTDLFDCDSFSKEPTTLLATHSIRSAKGMHRYDFLPPVVPHAELRPFSVIFEMILVVTTGILSCDHDNYDYFNTSRRWIH